MPSLVTLDEARDHLNDPPAVHDSQITRLAELATDIVLDYAGRNDPVTGAARTWTDSTVPGIIKAAVLTVLGKLWAHRGDEPSEDKGYLTPDVTRFLERYREPVVS